MKKTQTPEELMGEKAYRLDEAANIAMLGLIVHEGLNDETTEKAYRIAERMEEERAEVRSKLAAELAGNIDAAYSE